MESLLREKQAAEVLNVSRSFLQKGRVYGYGPAYVKYGAAVRYPSSALENYIQANTRQPLGASHA